MIFAAHRHQRLGEQLRRPALRRFFQIVDRREASALTCSTIRRAVISGPDENSRRLPHFRLSTTLLKGSPTASSSPISIISTAPWLGSARSLRPRVRPIARSFPVASVRHQIKVGKFNGLHA
jgi:hypothetical protein